MWRHVAMRKRLCDSLLTRFDGAVYYGKGCAGTSWLNTLITPNPDYILHYPPYNYASFCVSGLVLFGHCEWLKVECNCVRSQIGKVIHDAPFLADRVIDLVDILDDRLLEKFKKGLLGKYLNSYAYSKTFAEDVVQQHSKVLPVAVVRPSMGKEKKNYNEESDDDCDERAEAEGGRARSRGKSVETKNNVGSESEHRENYKRLHVGTNSFVGFVLSGTSAELAGRVKMIDAIHCKIDLNACRGYQTVFLHSTLIHARLLLLDIRVKKAVWLYETKGDGELGDVFTYQKFEERVYYGDILTCIWMMSKLIAIFMIESVMLP
ncbi:Putative fatty acyl-CoA reductase CG5065 [Eumeta japonica]|uniref:Fatty acyl-CoA reductase CG5065 n=1 Tax=Eumeta variegata TaxID=151549 RepID=A0A4C1Z904_EUMVA|nr:Putative fatty acyl-CoA reductase CG5065 [Eumeta japonica]